MLRADKNLTRPKDVDAHHVVAAQEPRAKFSREILFFTWFIGINDAANGVFMPRYASCTLANLPNCPPHQGIGNIHTETYHLGVYMRLQDILDDDASAARAELRLIAAEIVAGTFPYWERLSMKIWELRYDGVNQHAVLVPSDEEGNLLSIFMADGKIKHWDQRPKVEPFIEKRKKLAKPRADLSYLIAGSIVLNKKAHDALQDFLLPFGQLLELDCKGEIEYFYNVTNLIPCIDYEASEKKGKAVVKEVFLPNAVPEDTPLIFKDPYTVRSRIYLNQAGKEKLEGLTETSDLFGARFVEAGQGLL